jgi:ATP-dependent protease HslVU (ClpYQ) peptidase subunit
MTTIIGLQHKDKCVIYADNQTTDGQGRTFHHPQMSKITRRGDFLIAGAGEAFPCDVAQHIWNPPAPTEKDIKDLYHFMIAKVVPSLRKCLIDNGFNFQEENTDGEYRFQFLLAVGGTLFAVEDDLSVGIRSDGIYGVGNGAKYAVGALMAGATPVKAMKIAESQDAWTSGPFSKKEQYKYA